MAKQKLGSVKAVTELLTTSADLAADVAGTLPVANGGTGQSVYTDGQILVGVTSGNTLAKVSMTGDVTINNAGVTAIGALKVTNAMLAGSITDDKLNQLTTFDKVADSALTTNVPLLDTTNTFTGGKQTIALTDAATTTVTDVLDIQHVGGSTSTLFGAGIRFGLESANGTANRHAGNINFQWTTATDATRTAKAVIQLSNSATVADKLTIDGNGDLTATGNLSGVVINASTGFRVAGAATSGNYLRGDGTNFLSAVIAVGDLPTITVAKGGLGITTTPSNGQIPIGNGSTYTAATLTGTANQINVTNGAGSVTLTAADLIKSGSALSLYINCT